MRRPADEETEMQVVVEGEADEHAVDVAHALVVRVDVGDAVVEDGRLDVRAETGDDEVAALEHVQLLVRPQNGDVGDILGQCVVVGFVEGVLLLHVLEEEVAKVQVFAGIKTEVGALQSR